HATLGADVGRHPFQRHHGDGAGVLGDLRLLGRDHIHDHTALEHLGHAALDARRPGLGHLLAGRHGFHLLDRTEQDRLATVSWYAPAPGPTLPVPPKLYGV